VAEDNARPRFAVIDSASNAVVCEDRCACPAGNAGRFQRNDGEDQRTRHTGARDLRVTLSPDGQTLYAVNAGANSVAVIPPGASTPTGSQA